MQLYALNNKHQIIGANQALKHADYSCAECQGRVRVRGGLHRQNHFYHLEPNHHCHLSGKGMVHLQIQLFIKCLLADQDCFLEHRFPTIHRIADVAWLSQRLVFEVQCSPISAEEILQRNQDYAQLGWQVVWILHDQRYNQTRLTAAEWLLRHHPHYFTNIDIQGKGIIYDQFELLYKGIRRYKLSPLPVNLKYFQSIKGSQLSAFPALRLIEERWHYWPTIFEGDLLDLSLKAQQIDYFQQAAALQKKMIFSSPSTKRLWLKEALYWGIVRPYLLVFQLLLEKICR